MAVSVTGVRIADDFRDNLLIDRFDPQLTTLPTRKRDHMRSENSEDALTWNVFRTLRQIRPTLWLPGLLRTTFGESVMPFDNDIRIELWRRISPPASILIGGYEEGDSEIDVVLETPSDVMFIEAKYTSDISLNTTHGPGRDQILRNIDVGSAYADTRGFWFALLVTGEVFSPEGVRRLEQYRSSFDEICRNLPHRTDRIANLRGLGLVRWRDLASVISDLRVFPGLRPLESAVLTNIVFYLGTVIDVDEAQNQWRGAEPCA